MKKLWSWEVEEEKQQGACMLGRSIYMLRRKLVCLSVLESFLGHLFGIPRFTTLCPSMEVES